MSTHRIYNVVKIAVIIPLLLLAGAGKSFAFIQINNPGMSHRTNHEIVSYFSGQDDTPEIPELKSKTTARLYSAAFTIIPLALARLNARGYKLSEQTGTSLLLIAPGIIMGPSAGSIYSDDWTLAKRSMFIRTSTSALMLSGHFFRKNEDLEAFGLSMLISGGILLVSHAIYDTFFLSAHSVEYYNATIRLETGLSFHHTLPIELDYLSARPINKNILNNPRLDIRLHF